MTRLRKHKARSPAPRAGARPETADPSDGSPPYVLCLTTLVVIALALAARCLHLALPLTRDEGEYAYTGQLMLQAIPPFRLASNMKLPGTAAAYALIMVVFGQTPSGIHFGFLLVNLATVAAVFFLARRLLGATAAWAAAAVYASLSAGLHLEGMFALAEHFVLLPALLATLLLLRWTEFPRKDLLFGSGLLYGLAVLMKQSGVFFPAFGAACLLWTQRGRWRVGPRALLADLSLFGLGCLLPLAALCLLLWQAGVFPRFWFWTVAYARAYGTLTPPSLGLDNFLSWTRNVAPADLGPWLLAFAGLVLLWRDGRRRAAALWTTAFLGFSFLAVCPGWYFRAHYFVLLLPAAALLAGAAAALGGRYLSRNASAWLFCALLMLSALPQFYGYMRLDDAQLSRALFRFRPFPQAVVVADYIREHSGADDRLAVLGSEPEIYFYARRRSVTDYIYTYALGEPQPYAARMQQEMIRDIETAKPAYIVMVNSATSWLFHSRTTKIFDWAEAYAGRYDLVGIAETVAPDKTVYAWGGAAAAYRPQSPDGVLYTVFRRRDPPPASVPAAPDAGRRGNSREFPLP